MNIKITKKFLTGLNNDTGKDQFHRDTVLKGFGVKVTPTNGISFIVEARIKRGGSKRVTLGRFPAISVDEARDKARRTIAQYREGIDPVQQERELREQQKQEQSLQQALNITFGKVFEDFTRARSLKPKTEYDYRNTAKNCFLDWMNTPIREITRKDIETRFFEIQERGGRSDNEKGGTQAKKAIRILSSLFGFAMAEEIEGSKLVTENPTLVLKEKRIKTSIKRRSSYIEPEQIEAFIKAAYVYGYSVIDNKTISDFLMLLLFTGVRREEALSLRWDNVNMQKQYFIIKDTKNGLDHLIPMSDFVFDLFKNRNELNDKYYPPFNPSPWVFPATRGNGHLKEPRKQLDKIAEKTEIKVTCHDLRRTFASIAHLCGLDPYAIKRTLNHKSKDVTEYYIQKDMNSMRVHFQLIADKIKELSKNDRWRDYQEMQEFSKASSREERAWKNTP